MSVCLGRELWLVSEPRHVENPRPLLEEGPLLGKEQLEARHVDLASVYLRLGEVGVDGQGSGQACGDALEDVHPPP